MAERKLMYRRKVMVTAVALFAIGAAFTAQPISVRADRHRGEVRELVPWAPGTDGVIAAYESSTFPLAPPR
jgi:hypothetical protein